MAVPLRADFDAVGVRCWARKSKGRDHRRGGFSALAAIYEGASRTGGGQDWRGDASDRSRLGAQVQRRWSGGSDRPWKATGTATASSTTRTEPPLPRSSRAARSRLFMWIVRWRIVDLCQWIFAEFRVVISRQTLSRELRAMGYRKLSARPRHHAQAAGAIEDFKKSPRSPGRRIARENGVAPERRVEVWFADEARVGQKNKITSPMGQARHAPERSQRSANGSPPISSARSGPKDGKGAALVMPRCDTEAMNLHLAEIATQIAPGAHAALLVDQAGWHLSGGLIVPPNITPDRVTCEMYAPELNPQENIWQFMRENWLSNRVFKSFNDIVDPCCDAWNKLIDQPWRIMSIGIRDWAYRS